MGYEQYVNGTSIFASQELGSSYGLVVGVTEVTSFDVVAGSLALDYTTLVRAVLVRL